MYTGAARHGIYRKVCWEGWEHGMHENAFTQQNPVELTIPSSVRKRHVFGVQRKTQRKKSRILEERKEYEGKIDRKSLFSR